MSRARGGKPRKYAALRCSSSQVGADEAELFFGKPKNPYPEGTGDYFEWARQHPQGKFSKPELEKRLESSVPEAAWKEAEHTIGRYTSWISDHDSPHANNDKNDPNSFGATQNKWVHQLDRMFGEINAMRKNEMLGDFWNRYKMGLYEAGNKEAIYGPDQLRDNLNAAQNAVFHAAAFIERAVPMEIELPHPATIRRDAGRELKATAKKFNLPGKKFVKAFNIYADVDTENGFNEWYQSLNKTD